MKTVHVLLILGLIGTLLACGGSSPKVTPPTQSVKISISPNTASTLVNQATQFTATVTGATDTSVTWSIQEANGGTVSAGLYTAPWTLGTYHVVATSNADTTKSATATVSVSAQFAFIEEYPAGDATPFSMTPEIGTYAPDGTLTISGITDQGTGNPVSAAMENLALSPDGTKGTFDIWSPTNTDDIFVANADGSGSPTQLTTDGASWWPIFSADGRQIIYLKWTGATDIWAMNADGSNQHVIFAHSVDNSNAYSARFSPDGTKIVAELLWYPADPGVTYDGIAIMNADGTNAVPLTGGASFSCQGWDENPAFTPDGTQILFSRLCEDPNNSCNRSESIYIMNADGTNLTQLSNSSWGVQDYDPLPVADTIVFQTNRDYLATTAFEIYSMKADGSAVTRLTNNAVFDGIDDWWYNGPDLCSAQDLQGRASTRLLHGAAGRAEKIRKLQQHRNGR